MNAEETRALLKELEAKRKALPEPPEHAWWRVDPKRTAEELERTRLIGTRTSLDILIDALSTSLSVIEEREERMENNGSRRSLEHDGG